MSTLFQPKIALHDKTTSMEQPPYAEQDPTGPGQTDRGTVDGQLDATPLPNEGGRYSDAYNTAVTSGATEADTTVCNAQALSARADALRFGAAEYNPDRNPGDGAKEARHLDHLRRQAILRSQVATAESVTRRTANELAEEGARPTRPQAGLTLALATLGLAVPNALALYAGVAEPALGPSWSAAATATTGGLLVAAATTWTLARGLHPDPSDAQQGRVTLLVASVGVGLAVGLLHAAGGAPLVSAGLALLAGLGTAVTTLVARKLHRDLIDWEPRHRLWTAREEQWKAAQRYEAQATQQLAACEAAIETHIEHVSVRASAVRAAEIRADSAEKATVAGYHRGVAANSGVVAGWPGAPRTRPQQIARFHHLRTD